MGFNQQSTGRKLKSGRPSLYLKSNRFELAEPTGLEPATSDVTGRRSNQLNYDSAKTSKLKLRRALVTLPGDVPLMVGTVGLEPTTPAL